MKLADFKGLFKKSTATFESVENPYGDYYIVKLKAQPELVWEAGEHGIFTLPERKVEGKKWRAFSVASISEEGYMMIGTRTGKSVSSFKKQLISMKKGEKVSVRGPFGWFKLMDDVTPMVLVATGVGITPIRALLKKLENESRREIHVVHVASDYHLFEDDLKSLAEANDKIKLQMTSDAAATQDILKDLVNRLGNDAYYYISGSISATRSLKKLLKGNNVERNRIIHDPFLGY